jgi:hypothetical protein
MPIRDSIRGTLLLVGGAGILASAVLQGALNVPHLRQDMLEIGMRPSLLAAISLVLYFSVVAMFAFAALVLSGAISQLRGKAPQLVPLWLIAGSYLIFGFVAFVRIDPNAHFLGYAFMGFLVAMGAAPSPSGIHKNVRGAA